MDPRLIKYYNRELQYMREMGGEFAKEFPKVAGRLSLDGFECADPYVERLLEGFSFLAARIQLRMDAEFPRFTQHLLEMAYPHYLAPLPSMTIAQFQPDRNDTALAEGVVIPRGSALRGQLGKGETTACEYRTAHDLRLWPLELAEAEYFSSMSSVGHLKIPQGRIPRAGLRLRLKTTGGLRMNALHTDRLSFYLRGRDGTAMRLYEQLLGNSIALVLRPADRSKKWAVVRPPRAIRRVGFEEHEALLPPSPRSFSGYRLLQEYFAFPERYNFVEFTDLAEGFRYSDEDQIEIVALFDRAIPDLEKSVDGGDFALYCVPAINLFPKRGDRIHLNERDSEYHVVPDRTRPMDFEVHTVTGVVGHGTRSEQEQEFLPFYATNDLSRYREHSAFYSLRREPRVLSSRQARVGPRSNYIGSEVYLSLVDAKQAPYSHHLRQLAVTTLCTNRDLPLHMAIGKGATDFTLEVSAPVVSIRAISGPTPPRASLCNREGELAWRLISHLSLNYQSLMDSDERSGAAALRQILSLYAETGDASVRKQIEGVRSVSAKPINRRVPHAGPITFGRGLEVTLDLDEAAFEGSGVFLLGGVLAEFFRRYVSINSFTETVVKSVERGEVMRWPVAIGQRPVL